MSRGGPGATATQPAGGERVASGPAPLAGDSVAPIPPRLMAALESGPPVPLDDVVPGEPEHARLP